MNRSLEYLDRSRDASRAELERRLGHAAERLTAECERTVKTHPFVSLGAAGLTGMLAAGALTGRAHGSRGHFTSTLAHAVQKLFTLRRLFGVL